MTLCHSYHHDDPRHYFAPHPGMPEDAEFVFESNLADFDKVEVSSRGNRAANDDDTEENEEETNNVNSNDDLFDSLSCDAIDRQNAGYERRRNGASISIRLGQCLSDVLGGANAREEGGGGRKGGRGRGGTVMDGIKIITMVGRGIPGVVGMNEERTRQNNR